MNTIYFKKWSSPICELFFYADDEALLILAFKSTHTSLAKKLGIKNVSKESSRIIEKAIKQLDEYFAGARKAFEIPLKPTGTPFQKSAWQALTSIPFGHTLSYSEQAQKINSTGAVRAVGSANGRNPISIIVPCHRVITQSGKISGYAGGPIIKQKLLMLEGVSLDKEVSSKP